MLTRSENGSKGTVEFRSPVSFDRRISHHHGNILGFGPQLQNVGQIGRKIEIQENAGIVFRACRARYPTDIGAHNQHRRRRKNLRPIALQEKRSRGANRHDQIGRTVRKQRLDVFDKRCFFPGILGPGRIKRDLIEFYRLRRLLDEFSPKIGGHIAPRRVGVTESMQDQHTFRLRGVRLHREQKKETQTPTNYARPRHSGKGRPCQNYSAKTTPQKHSTNLLAAKLGRTPLRRHAPILSRFGGVSCLTR